jgi:hypothetical protein
MTDKQTLWAYNPAVRRWTPLITGMDPRVAVDEMLIRKDRVRRNKAPTQFTVRPDGEPPPPIPK